MLKNLLTNTDLLLNIVYLVVFLFITYKILSNTLWASIRKKIDPFADQRDEKDFDRMIKRKMELLRANNGQYVPEEHLLSPTQALLRKEQNKGQQKQQSTIPVQYKALFDDLSWGSGEEVKKIIKLFQREFSYTPNEQNLREKLKIHLKDESLLPTINQSTKEEILTLFYSRALFEYYVEEICDQKYSLIKKIAIRLEVPVDLFAYAFQYMLLNEIQSKERFQSKLLLGNFDILKKQQMTSIFFTNHGMQIAKSVNAIQELIKEHFVVADFIRPWPEITKNSSVIEALSIMRAHQSFTVEEIKRNYKKIAMEKHPDKIAALKLPKEIEQNALKQFQIIQLAYEIISKQKG